MTANQSTVLLQPRSLDADDEFLLECGLGPGEMRQRSSTLMTALLRCGMPGCYRNFLAVTGIILKGYRPGQQPDVIRCRLLADYLQQYASGPVSEPERQQLVEILRAYKRHV